MYVESVPFLWEYEALQCHRPVGDDWRLSPQISLLHGSSVTGRPACWLHGG